MKIDYIANVRMPTEKAHGGQIMKMCEAWGKNNKVVLWAPTRFNHIKADPFDYYGVNRNFIIKKILSIDLLPLGNILGKFGFWAQNFSFALNCAARIFFKKMDFIFSRDFWAVFLISLSGKKVVYEIHDSPNRHPITKFAFKKIYKFVVTNRYKAEEMMNNFGVQREKIFVAQNGVEADSYDTGKTKTECRAMLNLPQDKKIILYCGHLYSWKGADVLLETALASEDADMVFVFVGGTDGDVLRFRSRAGFRENILILGHQEPKLVPFYLAAADILVLPNTAKENISLKETSPLKLFEYMAAGRPIVASDIPSIREVVSEKEVVFFHPDDAVDLIAKIKMVLSDYGGFQKMAEGAKKIAARYSWSGRADAILDFANNNLSSNV